MEHLKGKGWDKVHIQITHEKYGEVEKIENTSLDQLDFEDFAASNLGTIQEESDQKAVFSGGLLIPLQPDDINNYGINVSKAIKRRCTIVVTRI